MKNIAEVITNPDYIYVDKITSLRILKLNPGKETQEIHIYINGAGEFIYEDGKLYVDVPLNLTKEEQEELDKKLEEDPFYIKPEKVRRVSYKIQYENDKDLAALVKTIIKGEKIV